MSWTLFSQIALLMILASVLLAPFMPARPRKDKADDES